VNIAEPITRLNTALEGRYHIERQLGEGGMATVYLADDVRHERKVAVKVLKPELAAVVGADRFLAEIKTTANLQHPNILPLFDSGSADGLLYDVMPYVRGETLRERLSREGARPVDEAVDIARGIAAALDHAHRNGVIHRDVKPGNVLLSEGVPMVADFGISRAAAETTRVTATGISLGTPAYTSPEQATGEDQVDQRTDIYSLGCVLYEMLSGTVPFPGTTVQAVIVQHLTAPVPTLLDGDSTIPPNVDDAVRRALAKKREERFDTVAEMSAALVAPPAVEPMPDYSQVDEAVTRSTSPLAGRREEYAKLLTKLDAVGRGRGGTVFVSGEPGVGKTKLTEALLLEARKRGYVCNVGHSYEMDGAPPYLPFVEITEYAMRTVPPGRLRAVLGTSAAEMTRIVPQLRRMFPDIGEPLDLPPDQQRHYLHSQWREFLERASKNVPLVMLLDDLHWADESSLLLLEHLAGHVARLPILLLGTYRDVELEVKRPFAKVLERLTRQRLVERIALRRMAESEVADLLAQLGGPDPPPALVSAIYRETEGNPFFVEEVFRHLQQEGQLTDPQGRWRVDMAMDALEVPEGVKLVIGRRLERVTEACRGVLGAAAIIGPVVDLAVLEEVAGVDDEAMLDSLDEAESAGLVIAQQVKRQTRYTFAHELIRQTLIGELSVPRRLRRHLKTAEAFERVYAGREAEHAAALAYHYFQAGSVDEEKTTGYLLLAGQQALAAGAFDEALDQADKAFSVIESADARRRGDLVSLRASALRGLGQWREALDAFAEAFELLAPLGETTDLLSMTCTYAEMAYYSTEEHPRALDIMSRVPEASPDVPRPDRARLLALHAGIEGMEGRFDAGKEISDRALEMAKAVGGAEVLGMVLSERASFFTNSGRITDALAAAREACALLDASPRRWARLRARSRLAHVGRLAGLATEVRELARESEQEAHAVGNVGAAFTFLSARVDASQLLEPRISNLRATAVEIGRDFGELATWGETRHLYDGFADYWEGDFHSAVERLEGSGERLDNEAWMDLFWSLQFMCAAHFDAERARGILAAHEHRMPAPGRVSPVGIRMGLGFLIRGLTLLGEARRAAELYPVCVESLELGSVLTGPMMLMEHAAAVAATAGGDWDAADRHFTAALRVADENPVVLGQADTRLDWAQVLLARDEPGDEEHARALLEHALPIFERIGHTYGAGMCREMLAG
jgi:tetratricopeptide (TPR) repeat protein/tRNA A-37 threonylcarbamoyl transferase component Bud32